MKKIITLIILLFLINCKKNDKKPSIKKITTQTILEKPKESSKKRIAESNSKEIEYKYATAESGLLYRQKPNGKVLGKLPYGTKVEVLEVTKIEKIIHDEGEEIKGYWTKIKINKKRFAYVFNGFLGDEYNLTNIPKKILASPVKFIQTDQENAIVLPNTHKVYNRKLEVIGQLKINAMVEVIVLNKSHFKRPEKPNQDYCKWSNYIELFYKNKNYILFGREVLSIYSKEPVRLSNKTVLLVNASNYIQRSDDDMGLTFCYEGGFSNILIEDNNVFHHIHGVTKNSKFGLISDDSMGEVMGSIKIDNDTITAQITQGFQEGEGCYDVKFFFDKRWMYLESNHKRWYN